MSQIAHIQSADRSNVSASFDVEKGMNLTSLKIGGVEVMALSTTSLFEERGAGLGALIGPHFHRRNPALIPPMDYPNLFPFIKKMMEKQAVPDPFSHGVARYAPWNIETIEGGKIVATLSGNDRLNEVLLKEIEGFDFQMKFQAELIEKGIALEVSISSERPSLVGLHYYYALPQKSYVKALVKNEFNDQGIIKQPIPVEWMKEEGKLHCDLTASYDFGFQPRNDPKNLKIALETPQYTLNIDYTALSEDNQWQLWHPEGAPFVCIEPMSAKEPRNPQSNTSSLHVEITVDHHERT